MSCRSLAPHSLRWMTWTLAAGGVVQAAKENQGLVRDEFGFGRPTGGDRQHIRGSTESGVEDLCLAPLPLHTEHNTAWPGP